MFYGNSYRSCSSPNEVFQVWRDDNAELMVKYHFYQSIHLASVNFFKKKDEFVYAWLLLAALWAIYSPPDIQRAQTDIENMSNWPQKALVPEKLKPAMNSQLWSSTAARDANKLRSTLGRTV